MAAVFADLQPVFELAFVQVRLAPVAFDEDVFSLHYAFFRRNRFDALCFLTEPGHRDGRKPTTNNHKRRTTKGVPQKAQTSGHKRHKEEGVPQKAQTSGHKRHKEELRLRPNSP